MAAIDEKEFERWMKVLQGDIHGVHTRLDELNGRTRKNSEHIAVLQDRSTEDRAAGRKAGARWGGFVGGFLVMIAYLADKLFR